MSVVPLCATCGNREVEHTLVGNTYQPELVCDFGVSNYPNMLKCDFYEHEHVDGEES